MEYIIMEWVASSCVLYGVYGLLKLELAMDMMQNFFNRRFGSQVLKTAIISKENIKCVNGKRECVTVDIEQLKAKGVKICFHECNSEDSLVVVAQGYRSDDVSDAIKMKISLCQPLPTEPIDSDPGATGGQFLDNDNINVPSIASEGHIPNQTSRSIDSEDSEDNEDFPELTHLSGHHDISLVVFATKQIEHIVRKHFCKNLPSNKKIMLGNLIHNHSNLKERDEGLTFLLQALVTKRNILVHEIYEKKFSDRQSREEFIINSNIALENLRILSQQTGQFEDVILPRAGVVSFAKKSSLALSGSIASNTAASIDSNTASTSIACGIASVIGNVAAGSIFSSTQGWTIGLSTTPLKYIGLGILWVSSCAWLLPGPHTSTELKSENMKYHCRRMIKLDPHLQHAIVEDADGFFGDIFPKSMDEYLSEYTEI